jgi:hypothetical protein
VTDLDRRALIILCNLAQPDFATQVANHNVIFRIPTPVFGLGLVEATTGARIFWAKASLAPRR